MSTARAACGLFVLNGSIHVAGGHCNDGRKATASVERYDVALNTWSQVTPMNKVRSSSSSACAMLVEINLFDCLVAKVKRVGRPPSHYY
jgi:hypothetical protein